METLSKDSITVETIVHAPIAKVWECWNKPEHITKWCNASDDWHAPYAENDFKVGGKSKTTMAAKDGSFSFDFCWIYTGINHHEFLSYTMEDGRKATVKFEQTDQGVKITEIFEPESQNSTELQRGGWQAILDNFKKYVEGIK